METFNKAQQVTINVITGVNALLLPALVFNFSGWGFLISPILSLILMSLAFIALGERDLKNNLFVKREVSGASSVYASVVNTLSLVAAIYIQFWVL